ncbi:MAG TPA: 4Fe-4S dicluster domain-containing protein [Acidobacteriota bacterium]|nr:4Fe-4S dicluster domain-containing protein [Acidobacteriota bacterium]
MPRWGMVIDLDKCTGCRACETACAMENNIPIVSDDQLAMGRGITWMKVLTQVSGEFPHNKVTQVPRPCMQCDNPPCAKVCPVKATYTAEDGIVAQIYPRCIGCRYCANACPYSVKYFNYYEPNWPGDMRRQLNRDVSVRPKGVVEKCTFCHHRLQKAREIARAENRPLAEADFQPACAEICPSKAIIFGDLENQNHRVFELSRGPRASRLLEDLGTEPKVFYLKKEI